MCKKMIAETPGLDTFDPEGKSYITVDASAIGLGAVFTQVVNSREKVVTFISRAIRGAEKHYSTIEKGALACVWAVEKLKNFLWGRPFTLVTDHKPLTYMMDGIRSGNASSRLVRLIARLQEFNFEILHIPGGKNVTADCLSKLLPAPENDNEIIDQHECVVAVVDAASSCNTIISEEWKESLEADSILSKVKEFVANGWPTCKNLEYSLQGYAHVADELSIENDILLRQDLFVPPVGLRNKRIQLAYSGHPGVSATKKIT